MSYKAFAPNSLLPRLLLPLTLAVSLQACSTFSSEALQWAEAAKAQDTAVKTVAAAQETPTLPPMPAYVEKCVREGLARGKKGKGKQEPDSADKKVLALLQSEEERKKCSGAILQWYKQLQAANQKTATVAK